jgi:diaminopimelate decarboxylase
MGIEVMSALEFDLAHAVGFRARRIICNGAGRPDALLRRACSEEATIVIESEGDLERLIPSARAQGKVSLGLRLQLDVSRFAESPYALRPHKLGLPLDSAAQLQSSNCTCCTVTWHSMRETPRFTCMR